MCAGARACTDAITDTVSALLCCYLVTTQVLTRNSRERQRAQERDALSSQHSFRREMKDKYINWET